MAEEREPQVSRRYRELGSEEPPRALDEAILAAARRSVSSRRGWYVPLAAAAVALLAVGIALHVEREKPDAELMTAPSDARQAPAEVKQEQPPPAVQPEPRLQSGKRSANDVAREATPEVSGRQSAPRQPESERRFGFSREEAPAPKAAQADALEETPERALERIAELRKQGRHEDADKALAEFRKRYPDHRIPDSLLNRDRPHFR